MRLQTLVLADGSHLAFLVDEAAPAGAELLVHHHGTPAAGPEGDPLLAGVRAAGFRLVELVRPGYGASTRQPGRCVADVVPLVTVLLEHLGVERFATLGWSGGGPHALATAAMMPDRCVGALSLAGVAPYAAQGLDWLQGMGQDNLDEFAAAVAGESTLAEYLGNASQGLASVTGADVVAQLSSLLPEVDREHLAGGAGETMAAQIRWSLAQGIWGWLDDDLAFVSDWGLELGSLQVPVLVWQGAADLMVPFAHGQWLADRIPTAVPNLAQGEGHLSLVARLGPGLAYLRSLF